MQMHSSRDTAITPAHIGSTDPCLGPEDKMPHLPRVVSGTINAQRSDAEQYSSLWSSCFLSAILASHKLQTGSRGNQM
jgi:hypothetical protein